MPRLDAEAKRAYDREYQRRKRGGLPPQPKPGLDLEPLCSQAEVAAALGLSRQRVGQVEREALVKVRQALEEWL